MRIVDEMPNNGRVHDWDQLLDGNIYLLEQGTDYPGKPENFRNQVHQTAARRGVKVVTRIRLEGLYVQAKPLPQER